ncbi:polyketide cyclase [Modestobacter excelsi]|uniref:polyketide cyclase n=1 Tax=Modestobacter excelsi TaxID=2213161 RepID=UPI00110CE949|nr:polyketide cyclase [Modestobacter excelsi]
MIGDRWGVSAEEVARHYPCDDLVPTPALQAWRGVTVHANRSLVWSWVTQIRLAPYSYDWVDNLGRRSPQELRGLAEPVPGQNFTTAGGRPAGRILSVEPGVQLTGRIMGAVMSYVLVPTPGPTDESTRLLLKVAVACGRPTAPLLSVGDLVMARRQLLNLKRLAERAAEAQPR